MQNLMTVDFHGTKLFGFKRNGDVFVALKPIVEAMGLAWQGQLERIKRDPVLREGISVMLIPTPSGPQKSVGLRLTLLHGWLFTISSLRIKSGEIRQKVQLFQRECYDVLARQFLGGNQPIAIYSAEYERRSIGLAHEARLIYGRRAGAEVWELRGLPVTPAMDEAFRQLELFDRGRMGREAYQSGAKGSEHGT